MERGRSSFYSSDTLSSSSSRSSSSSYASIKAYTSRISTNVKTGEFWTQFERNSTIKRRTFGKILKDIFTPKVKEVPKETTANINEEETSFISEIEESCCPPGLYCVIDEFLTEYDLRIIEEEERADIVARKGEQEKKKRRLIETV